MNIHKRKTFKEHKQTFKMVAAVILNVTLMTATEPLMQTHFRDTTAFDG